MSALLFGCGDRGRISPDNFDKPYVEAVEDYIHSKYSNRVLPGVGMCISLYDILHVGDPFIYPGDGATHSDIRFRLIVFRPFIGEVLTGTIARSDEDGITVSLQFFSDIIIKPHLLQENSIFQFDLQTGQHLWVWQFQESNVKFFMDVGEQIRFRVHSVQFDVSTDHSTPPKVEDASKLMLHQQQQQLQQQQQQQQQQQLLSSAAPAAAAAADSTTSQFQSQAQIQAQKDKEGASQDGTGSGEPPAQPAPATAVVDALSVDAKPPPPPPTTTTAKPPMRIIGAINESGLGMLSWWTAQPNEGTDEQQQEQQQK